MDDKKNNHNQIINYRTICQIDAAKSCTFSILLFQFNSEKLVADSVRSC